MNSFFKGASRRAFQYFGATMKNMKARTYATKATKKQSAPRCSTMYSRRYESE